MGDTTEIAEKAAEKAVERLSEPSKPSPLTNILLAIASTLGAAAVIGLVVMYGKVTSMGQTLEDSDAWATKEQVSELKADLTKRIDKNEADIEKLEEL